MNVKASFLFPFAIALLTTAMGPMPAKAADEQGPVYDLGSVVITATRTEENVDDVAASVVVITNADIEEMAAATLKDVLEKTVGLNIQYALFPHPSAASKAAISIRGQGANGTLLLLDGKRLSAETMKPYDMDRIPASMIQKIEIIKGPMSALYGSDAMGGVINIITKKPTEGKAQYDADLKGGLIGDNGNFNYSADFNVRGKDSRLGYAVFGGYRNAEAYTEKETYISRSLNPMSGAVYPLDSENGRTGTVDVSYRDESQTASMGSKLEYDLTSSLTAGLDLNYFKEKRNGDYRGSSQKPQSTPMPPYVFVLDTPVNSRDDNWRTDYDLSLDWAASKKWGHDFRMYRSKYKKRNRVNALNFVAPENRKYQANVDIASYEAVSSYISSDSLKFVGGAEYREESRDGAAINPNPSSYAFVNKTILYRSAFLQGQWKLSERLSSILGARNDSISREDNEQTYKAGFVYKAAPDVDLRFNFAQAYRTPDVAESYVVAMSPGDIPLLGAEAVYGMKTTTHELKPESTDSFELGLSGRRDALRYSAALFFNNVEDKIEIERVDANGDSVADYQTYVNKTKVDIRGFDFGIGYKFKSGLDLDFAWNWLDTEDKGTNQELTLNPKNSAAVSLSYDFKNDFSASVSSRYVGKQYTSSTTKADGYILTDIGWSKSFDWGCGHELYGGVNNLFDQSVDKALGSNPGRYYYIGFRTFSL